MVSKMILSFLPIVMAMKGAEFDLDSALLRLNLPDECIEAMTDSNIPEETGQIILAYAGVHADISAYRECIEKYRNKARTLDEKREELQKSLPQEDPYTLRIMNRCERRLQAAEEKLLKWECGSCGCFHNPEFPCKSKAMTRFANSIHVIHRWEDSMFQDFNCNPQNVNAHRYACSQIKDHRNKYLIPAIQQLVKWHGEGSLSEKILYSDKFCTYHHKDARISDYKKFISFLQRRLLANTAEQRLTSDAAELGKLDIEATTFQNAKKRFKRIVKRLQDEKISSVQLDDEFSDTDNWEDTMKEQADSI